jgi:mycothiol synthase
MSAPTIRSDLLVRSPTQDDAERVADLYNACSMAEIGVVSVTAAELRTIWQTPGFDRERDAWMVETPDGQLAGYLDLWSPEPYVHIYADGCVHPAHRGQGIGRHLLRLSMGRARELIDRAPADMRVLLLQRVNSSNEAVKTLLASEGYQLARHFWRMAVELDKEPPHPTWPDGITVRPMVPGQDEHTVYEAVQEAFEDHYDHARLPFDQWLAWHTQNPDTYEPALWFVAMDGDEISGVAICDKGTVADPQEGWIANLGVRRPWRRHGLGMALLLHSLGALHRYGRRRVALSVDAASLTGATRLYERVGMRVERQWDSYAIELRPGKEVSTNE